jgi:hypothetical protein
LFLVSESNLRGLKVGGRTKGELSGNGTSFRYIFSVRKCFLSIQQRSYVKVVGMRSQLIMFGIVLIMVGLAIFFYGTSMGSNVLNSDDLISGTYLAVVGTFLAIAGFLVITAQVFRGHSVLY